MNAANAAGAASPPVGDMIMFLIMAAWVAFFYGLARVMWHYGVRQYSGYGG